MDEGALLSPDDTSSWRHRNIVFFHMLFRTAAVIVYIFCNLFSSSFIANFIVIISLIGLDFWTVKNISGRFLVGLRWWNEINDEGVGKWRFESRKGGESPQKRESRLFWWSLYVFALIWIVFGFVALLKLSLSYLLVTAIGISLNVSNVMGYRKCQKDAKTRGRSNGGSDVAGEYIENRIGQSITSAVTTRMFGSANNNGTV
eukprot:m.14875 g.14875  ORF g.14875 m.14875 type:complete len:202 (+) comp7770_c0_seq1:74-679(+)